MKRYIKSSEFGKDFDVFMLMEYIPDTGPDTAGPAGDRFDCIGKFYASNLAEARRQLEIEKSKHPDSNLGGLYVSEYNPTFDWDDVDSVYGMPIVYSDLATLFDKRVNTSGDYDNYDDSEGLPFEI